MTWVSASDLIVGPGLFIYSLKDAGHEARLRFIRDFPNGSVHSVVDLGAIPLP